MANKIPFIGRRGIHLDLKGLPPLPGRLLEILDLLAGVDINFILVEWEDSYPWKKFPELKSPTAYSEKTVKEFLHKAEKLSIEAVPLVQSYGHMENVLSKRSFKNLRELPDNVSDICPCREGGREVVISMIDELLKAHDGKTSYFHLGGDEAWTMGSCPDCKAFIKKHGKAALYLKQIMPLVEHVRRAGLRPILWDDMMRGWGPDELADIAECADLMVWTYGKTVPEKITAAVKSFSDAGVKIWGASAFKGAEGCIADIPDPEARKENMRSWLEIHRQKGLEGIVSTGWSRCSTFVAPCESLESSLDCLVVSAWAMRDGTINEDCIQASRHLLENGSMSEIAGQRFTRCAEASLNLKKWKERTSSLLVFTWPRLSCLFEERGRLNRGDVKRILKDIELARREGKKTLEEWREAHRGLIDDIWLDGYVKSRLGPFETYSRALREKLERFILPRSRKTG